MSPQQRSAAAAAAAATPDRMNGNGEVLGVNDNGYAEEAHDKGYYFLTPQAARELPHFQYKGQDLSILYRYILAPLAQFCVNHLTPSWLAPNVITLAGLSLMALAYSLMWYYDALLECSDDAIPRWVFLYNAVAMLVYQTLDNMDGRQARKTKSSSPMGLLFDHGCDAVNSLFGSANWMHAMSINPRKDPLTAWTMLMGPYALFFVDTWEEYHTGILILPIMNGANEGLLGGAMVSLASWYYGPQFWQQPSPVWEQLVIAPLRYLLAGSGSESFMSTISGVRNADIIVLLSSIGFVQEVGLKTISTVRKCGPTVLVSLAPFVTLIICSLVMDCHLLWMRMPRTSFHLCATLFVDMTTDLMLAHISNQPYNATRRWILLPLVGLAVVATAAVPTATGLVDHVDSKTDFLAALDMFLLVYTTAALTYYSFKVVLILHEVSHVLQIWCFDIVSPRGRAAPQKQQHVDAAAKNNNNKTVLLLPDKKQH